MEEKQTYHAVIIGGSYAGLSAAMALARARRNVLIIDSGMPCNRQTPHSHNMLTLDGATPSEIASLGKKQVLAYPMVKWLNDEVVTAEGRNKSFRITTKDGVTVQTGKVIMATGIKDILPPLKGFSECWGISVIHCPYCHGYEYRDQPTGILVNGNLTLEMARLIWQWTNNLTILTNGVPIGDSHASQLDKLNIKVVETPISELHHIGGHLDSVHFSDGVVLPLKALYARVPFEYHNAIASVLGCELDDKGYIKIDEMQRTTVPGVYAAGDNCTMFRSVANAIAAGNKAGALANHELISEQYI